MENSFPILANTLLIASSSCTEDLFSKFWELDSVPDKKHLSNEEKECENQFDQTTKRRDDCRFVVELPFNKKTDKLGLSKAAAKKRFLNLEKKLLSNKKLHEKYKNFVKEFIDLGHLEKVPEKELETKSCYYLPHHCVLKSDSTTTKLRVVFDASAKTTSGISLNECLMVGPKLQDDIFDILIRFRFFKIRMSADVAKMYRQVELNEKHRDYHRLLWRFGPNEDVQTYRMTRVTYGVASSYVQRLTTLQAKRLRQS